MVSKYWLIALFFMLTHMFENYHNEKLKANQRNYKLIPDF